MRKLKSGHPTGNKHVFGGMAVIPNFLP